MSSYITLPGTSGNYLSTVSVNLCDADTAHLYQGVGTWIKRGYNTGAHDTTTETGLFGGRSFKVGKTVADDPAPTTRCGDTTTGVAAAPAEVWSESAYVMLNADYVAATIEAKISILWFNAGGSLLSGGDGGYVDLVPGEFVQLTAVGKTAPANTAFVGMQIDTIIDGGGNVPIHSLNICQVIFRKDSVATFVPSLRIVGDLETRAKVAADFTPASEMSVLSFGYASLAPRMEIRTNGDLGFTIGDVAAYDSTDPISASDNTPTEFRITTSGTTAQFYEDGVAMGAAVTIADHDSSRFTEGYAIGCAGLSDPSVNRFTGDIYWAEVRDGIDGPVVARMDADDWIGV